MYVPDIIFDALVLTVQDSCTMFASTMNALCLWSLHMNSGSLADFPNVRSQLLFHCQDLTSPCRILCRLYKCMVQPHSEL